MPLVRRNLSCRKFTLQAITEISGSVTVIKNATSNLLQLLIEPTKLQIEIANVIPDLLLVAMQVGWQQVVGRFGNIRLSSVGG